MQEWNLQDMIGFIVIPNLFIEMITILNGLGEFQRKGESSLLHIMNKTCHSQLHMCSKIARGWIEKLRRFWSSFLLSGSLFEDNKFSLGRRDFFHWWIQENHNRYNTKEHQWNKGIGYKFFSFWVNNSKIHLKDSRLLFQAWLGFNANRVKSRTVILA